MSTREKFALFLPPRSLLLPPLYLGRGVVFARNFPGPCVLLKLLQPKNFLLSLRRATPSAPHARGWHRKKREEKMLPFVLLEGSQALGAARRSGWVFSGLAHRPRIITDQISDISRGMNVLWCVFYFISLSYNPPSNGTRTPEGWVWVWVVGGSQRVWGCEWCHAHGRDGRGGAREMSNAKLRKHGSKIG